MNKPVAIGAGATSAPPSIDFRIPSGEPAFCAPDSVHWRVFKNPIALAVGGVAAVLLEFADPRTRSGVWDHSVYKVDPIGRSQRTGLAAMVGVYGPQSVARRVIGGVNRMHRKVSGETPAGDAYRALDPELLNWVSATAQFGFLTAYDRFVRRLTAAEKARFWRDAVPIAELYGVTVHPSSDADFFDMMDGLLPRFEPHPINREFLAIIQSGRAAPTVPRFLHRSLGRAAVSILPPVVRDRLQLGQEFDLNGFDRLSVKAMAAVADRVKDRTSPAWQAAERLGLPGDTAWR